MVPDPEAQLSPETQHWACRRRSIRQQCPGPEASKALPASSWAGLPPGRGQTPTVSLILEEGKLRMRSHSPTALGEERVQGVQQCSQLK